MQPVVQRWFQRRTSVGLEWDGRQLAQDKQGARVSVVLPAKDEAQTVGHIVGSLRRELMDRVPLIDELVVIDSDSEDDTADVARVAGARVVRQSAILPHLEPYPGKGEALWKSLHVTSGDIVAFIDADLEDFDPQFAVGLLGPLIADPSVEFVKAFYDRALQAGDTLLPAGGGRVTEILARPLLNLHWPMLAGFVQPLAGEYAGRRTLFERIPFLSGYGVEIAMLIDVVGLVGLDAMAQVDLGSRQHRNRSDAALGQMASQVYLAVLSRLQREAPDMLTRELSTALTQFTRVGETVVPVSSDVAIIERPALLEIAAYCRRLADLRS